MEVHAVVLLCATLLVLGTAASSEAATAAAEEATDMEAEILRRTLPAYGLMAKSAEMFRGVEHDDDDIAGNYDYYEERDAEDGAQGEASLLCRAELEVFRRAVDDRRPWRSKVSTTISIFFFIFSFYFFFFFLNRAIGASSKRVLDSSGVPRAGFVYGNNYWLGSRSQCLDTANRSPLVLRTPYVETNDEFPPFRPNYAVAHFRHNSSLQLHVRLPNEDLVTLGLCLPASCQAATIARLLEATFRDDAEHRLEHGRLYGAGYKLELVRDLRGDDLGWLLEARLLLVEFLLAGLVVLMCLGTAYEILLGRNNNSSNDKQEKERKCLNNNESNVEAGRPRTSAAATAAAAPSSNGEGGLGRLLLSFSVASNTRLIFGTRLGPDSIGPIHGIRFLGMVWIVMIHTVFYMSDYADNKAWSWRMAEGFAVQIISNSTLSVDTFFFLSGFLVAYMYFTSHRGAEERQRREEEVEGEPIGRRRRIDYGRKCGEFAGTVLRRYLRLTPAYAMTIGILQVNSAWYARTSQFYMTERPDRLCERYWWRNVLYVNNLFGRDTMCMSWSWYLSNDMQFFVIATFLLILSSVMDEQYNMLDVLYDPPWTRIGPYLIGMITAYIVTRLDGKLHLKPRSVAILWILGSSCNLSVLFGLYERRIDVLTAAFYVALSRTVWAVGLAWLLVACCTGHAGIVNKILCFKAWIPLSRLTYCAYLLNPFLINSIYLHSESAVHVDFLPNVSVCFCVCAQKKKKRRKIYTIGNDLSRVHKFIIYTFVYIKMQKFVSLFSAPPEHDVPGQPRDNVHLLVRAVAHAGDADGRADATLRQRQEAMTIILTFHHYRCKQTLRMHTRVRADRYMASYRRVSPLEKRRNAHDRYTYMLLL
ncbi:unnamed protein product [Trichogramma brassicae]|uniref:Nose resistant-to-fluoxetine protein N-terminal domain-containing protein n=1 Tax=Trichogramma brassicae TaxID=86971 RepID=A0A6H5IA74_9HYME|nr:unnamed protein product [Trichogramma brassicae]